MSRYIDADKLYKKTAELEAEAMEEVQKHDPKESSDEHISWLYWIGVLKERTAFKHDVAEAPTADVVEVVRCKDCVYYSESLCKAWSCFGTIKTPRNGYCHMAERKTKGETNV